MSRIGKKPIVLPKGVEIRVDGGTVVVKGPKGSLSTPVLAGIHVGVKDGKVELTRQSDEKQDRAFHGLNRALLQNAVVGVTDGYTKKLDLVGVGYRAEVKGNVVNFSCGYSHVVAFPMPGGIKIEVAADPKAKEITHITVTGSDKQMVGQVAKQIREIKPPDPYKLKGFRFVGEILKKKAGKATGK
jgi:large subunit ribosomal protein L6